MSGDENGAAENQRHARRRAESPPPTLASQWLSILNRVSGEKYAVLEAEMTAVANGVASTPFSRDDYDKAARLFVEKASSSLDEKYVDLYVSLLTHFFNTSADPQLDRGNDNRHGGQHVETRPAAILRAEVLQRVQRRVRDRHYEPNTEVVSTGGGEDDDEGEERMTRGDIRWNQTCKRLKDRVRGGLRLFRAMHQQGLVADMVMLRTLRELWRGGEDSDDELEMFVFVYSTAGLVLSANPRLEAEEPELHLEAVLRRLEVVASDMTRSTRLRFIVSDAVQRLRGEASNGGAGNNRLRPPSII